MSQNSCCVPGCEVTSKDGIPLHRFPNPDVNAEKFNSWVSKIGGAVATMDNFDVYSNRRVCHKHFEEIHKYPRNRLCKLAIPVLYLPEQRHIESVTLPDRPSTSGFLKIPCDIHKRVPSNWSSLPSNSPSSFTEKCGLNNDMSEEECTTTLFCICCLKSEIPYINLSTCSHGDFLNSFMTPEMKLKDQVVCYQCHNTLKKIKLFKLQIEKSFKILADSVENFEKGSQESSTLQTSQLIIIDISSKLYKRKPQAKTVEDPQSKRNKTDIDKDNLIPEEIANTNITERPQTITEHAKIGVGKSSLPVIDKNIEDALKIININQNSGCINLLTSSLQTISYSILGNIYNTNSDISNQSSIPKDISRSINTANDAALISYENLKTNTDLKIENQVSENMNTLTTPTIPVSNKNISINNTIESNRIAIDDKISVEETDIVESATNEALNPIEKHEHLNGGQSDIQTDKPVVNYPYLMQIKKMKLEVLPTTT